jgi:hypothetical protein
MLPPVSSAPSRITVRHRPTVGLRFLTLALHMSETLGGDALQPQQRRRPRLPGELLWPTMPSLPALPSPPKMPPLPGVLRRFRPKGTFTKDIAGALDSDSCEALVSDLTSNGEEWSLRVEREGVKVWRRKVEGSSYDEVRGSGVVSAPPSVVVALMKCGDAETIREYNPMYDQGHDLEHIDASTKVSYGSVRAIFPFKPRDTVTRVAFRELPTLTGTAILLKAVKHHEMPVRSGYVRAEIMRGMHLIQPMKGDPSKTNFTFTQHINTGGVIPAWLMNTLVTQDAVTFVKRLGSASAARK